MKLRKAALHLMVAAVIPISAAVVAPQMAGAATTSGSGVFWVDNEGPGTGTGPVVEHDPHLACATAYLWANGLANGNGTYDIVGIPPTGTGDQVYRGTPSNPFPAFWSYDVTLGGAQTTDAINIGVLIRHSIANGDTPLPGQGYHFKAEITDGGVQKNVTFWVNC